MEVRMLDRLQQIWTQLYEREDPAFDEFVAELRHWKQMYFTTAGAPDTTWYKDAIVYSAYADQFNGDLPGLREKLPYLQELGITCLWLLPILESPMQDAGFDISDFDVIRAELLGLPPDTAHVVRDRVFAEFLADVHDHGMRLIFDIAINHCSVAHLWFKEARQSPASPKRDYFIWSDTADRFPQARLLMKGIHDSNWAWDEAAGQYYFHRFFDIQPDLNYHNPQVLLEMTRMLIRWKLKGVDGIRADAVPFLWKAEGTSCESLLPTHKIIKFFRVALDYLQPGTLLLAEACQPPKEVVAYFGDGDECQGAYHFPVMPRIFRVLAEENAAAVKMVMAPEFTPEIPPTCQWFVFLRCHDELTLEMVTPEERKFLYNYYTKDPRWDYRQGEGISARLATLFQGDDRRIRLAYSIMFTLPGTPIIYYGDEFGQLNDEAYYQQRRRQTGYQDSRYFVRGPLNWEQVERDLRRPDSLAHRLYHSLQTMIRVRKMHPAFSRGALEFVRVRQPDQTTDQQILAYTRAGADETRFVLQNLSSQPQQIEPELDRKPDHDLLDQTLIWQDDTLIMPPYAYYWL